MGPIKYLWNEKDDIFETLNASRRIHKASDVVLFVTSLLPVSPELPSTYLI